MNTSKNEILNSRSDKLYAGEIIGAAGYEWRFVTPLLTQSSADGFTDALGEICTDIVIQFGSLPEEDAEIYHPLVCVMYVRTASQLEATKVQLVLPSQTTMSRHGTDGEVKWLANRPKGKRDKPSRTERIQNALKNFKPTI